MSEDRVFAKCACGDEQNPMTNERNFAKCAWRVIPLSSLRTASEIGEMRCGGLKENWL